MTIVLQGGYYYWVKRVPTRFLGIVRGAEGQPIKQVRVALHTDSRAEAEIKAAQVQAARLAEWEAMAAGDAASAARHYEAAKKLAHARGFSYVPMPALADGDLGELVARVLSLQTPSGGLASRAAAEAVLGAVPVALPPLTDVLTEYYDLTTTRHLKKSDAQRHRWKLPRERAVKNFLSVWCANNPGKGEAPPVNAITRADALQFRSWWSDRVKSGMKIESANKDLAHLSEILTTWAELTQTDLPNPFAKLRLEGEDERGVPGFTREFVKNRLLDPQAFAGMNDDAHDILLIMVNTGLRPSEITDAPLSDFELSGPIPFLRVAPNGRELKVAHTRREIPLLGVSLAAAKRLVARKGHRYTHKAGSWSAVVNKYMGAHGLKETPKHTAYSLRHYVENALLAAKVDDRVRADILGHKYDRPRYGDGGALKGRADALALIAL